MEALFYQFCEHISNNYLLQGFMIAAGSCFIEDPARCVVALLVANKDVNWMLALVSMTIGGMAGDLGLYLIGRYAAGLILRHRMVTYSKLVWIKSFFKNHAVKTLFVSRFIPGSRLLTFSAAGMVRYPIWKLFIIIFAAAISQAYIFLKFGDLIGDTVLPYLTSPWLKYGVFVFSIALLYFTFSFMGSRNQKKTAIKAAAHKEEEDA